MNGEYSAKIKYELFSNRALEENLYEIAYLFRAISFAESIHIKNHIKALEKILNRKQNLEDIININENDIKTQVKDTRHNLLQAIQGETNEFKKMYKNFIKRASKSGLFLAEFSFDLARKAEHVHKRLYESFLKKLDNDEGFTKIKLYVCKICGNVEIELVPDKCPLCDHDKKFFIEIEP
ncbi:MAG: rubrerythrin family protein [Promethearchaeota archaeon]